MRICTHNLALVCILAAAGVTVEAPALAEDPPQRPMDGAGVWMKRSFSSSGGGQCKQVWSCGPTDSIEVKEADGERLTFLSDQVTTGTCRATDETACRSCTAPQPATACTWKIETDAQ